MGSQSVDDRTNRERGQLQGDGLGNGEELLGLVKEGRRRLMKSRYSGMSRYIGIPRDSDDEARLESLNDVGECIDDDAFQILKSNGIDNMLAKHIAHLFTR